MSRYIILLKFTEKGSSNIKKSTGRASAFAKAATRSGVRIEAQYWTIGAYDGVLILSADNETKILHCLAELASAVGSTPAEAKAAVDTLNGMHYDYAKLLNAKS